MREREREEEDGSRRAEGDTGPGPEAGFPGPDRGMALVQMINKNGLNGWGLGLCLNLRLQGWDCSSTSVRI